MVNRGKGVNMGAGGADGAVLATVAIPVLCINAITDKFEDRGEGARGEEGSKFGEDK